VILQQVCSKSAASNPLIHSGTRWICCISTPGFWHPERFSKAPTIADEFGKIGGDIRRTRNRAGFLAKPPAAVAEAQRDRRIAASC
jgi:hypothetical protein